MATKNDSLSFDKLEQESIVIELRHPIAYLFWDRAGSVFDELKRRLPTGRMDLASANPGSVAIVYDGIFEITVETTRFAVGCSGHPVDVKRFLSVASVVYQTVVESIRLEIFNRIGLRQVFAKRFASLQKANDALSQLPAIAMLVRPFEGNKVGDISPSATVRMEEESRGTLISIKAAERDFKVNMPPIFWDPKKDNDRTINLHHSLFMFDVDTYTRNDVSIDQFELTEWVKQRIQSVKTDAEMFF